MSFVLGVLALCLLLEGAVPLLWPDFFRRRMAQMSEMAPGQLRFLGLAMCAASAVIGAVAYFA